MPSSSISSRIGIVVGAAAVAIAAAAWIALGDENRPTSERHLPSEPHEGTPSETPEPAPGDPINSSPFQGSAAQRNETPPSGSSLSIPAERFAEVPAGSYTMRSSSGFAVGVRKQDRSFVLDAPVSIGLYEVTNREYVTWLDTLPDDARKRHTPRSLLGRPIWPEGDSKGVHVPVPDRLDHPVVGINLPSACAFAAAHGCRLPTEAEWCAMASGAGTLRYPWGEQWERGLCNNRDAASDDTRPVGSFPAGRGPFGHYDLAGNVAEWLLTYENGDDVDPTSIDDDGNVAVRGGSFREGQQDVQTGWVWLKRAVYDRDWTTGFRLVRLR